MEAAHTPASLAASARLAAAELLLGGTTTVLTMETVHDTDAVFEALEPMGLRAVVGKCLMDADTAVPARLLEQTTRAIDESLALHDRWHGRGNGRLGAALAPRFAVSCSRELLEQVAALSRERGLLVHTHASENRDEVALVRSRTGCSNIEYLDQLGLMSPRLCVAHCVWVDEQEQALLARNGAHVLHCPGSNLKLASGIAPVAAMRALGIGVSLGADGAACNNHLDMFVEMRLAAGLQAVTHGVGTLTASDVLWMATRGGARALGMEADLGSLEVGKRADLIVIDRDRPHLATAPEAASALVYAARASDVRTVVVDGAIVVDDFQLTTGDAAAIAADARHHAHALATRAL
jgi:5-methylthioadenosine/S-adenosylhomocysteine deaminase